MWHLSIKSIEQNIEERGGSVAKNAPEKANAETINLIKQSLLTQFADLYGIEEYILEEIDKPQEPETEKEF